MSRLLYYKDYLAQYKKVPCFIGKSRFAPFSRTYVIIKKRRKRGFVDQRLREILLFVVLPPGTRQVSLAVGFAPRLNCRVNVRARSLKPPHYKNSPCRFFKAARAVRGGVVGHCARRLEDNVPDHPRHARPLRVPCRCARLPSGCACGSAHTNRIKREESNFVGLCRFSFSRNLCKNNNNLTDRLTDKGLRLYSVEPFFYLV